MDDTKEFSEDSLYHIPPQSLIGIMLSLLFLKRHECRTHQTKCLCGLGPNGQFGLKVSLISSLSRSDGNNSKGKNSERTRRDKEEFT